MGNEGKRLVERRPWTADSDREFTRNAIRSAPEPCRAALREYALWLEQERGLGRGSITVRVASARCFVGSVTKGKVSVAMAFGDLKARDVEDFFVGYCGDNGPGPRLCRAVQRLFIESAAATPGAPAASVWKRIYYGYSAHLRPVLQIFGDQLPAACSRGGAHDERVPE